MPREINPVQHLQIELIKLASFNSFKGPAVVSDLLAHPDLWEMAAMTDGAFHNAVTLRDIDRGYFNVSTLWLKVMPEHVKAIRKLALKWCADECEIMPDDIREEMVSPFDSNKDAQIMRLWWD